MGVSSLRGVLRAIRPGTVPDILAKPRSFPPRATDRRRAVLASVFGAVARCTPGHAPSEFTAGRGSEVRGLGRSRVVQLDETASEIVGANVERWTVKPDGARS